MKRGRSDDAGVLLLFVVLSILAWWPAGYLAHIAYRLLLSGWRVAGAS